MIVKIYVWLLVPIVKQQNSGVTVMTCFIASLQAVCLVCYKFRIIVFHPFSKDCQWCSVFQTTLWSRLGRERKVAKFQVGAWDLLELQMIFRLHKPFACLSVCLSKTLIPLFLKKMSALEMGCMALYSAEVPSVSKLHSPSLQFQISRYFCTWNWQP